MMLEGKKLSILGDSVSTYKGVSDDASANSTLLYNPSHYKGQIPLEKTYWRLLMASFGLELCVNNAWSGGTLSGRDNPDAGVNRANRLSRDDGTTPDIIIVFMGINDLGRRVDASLFASDYERTLATIKEKYPNAEVCCVNLPDRDPVMKQRTEIFNGIIESAVKAAGERFFVADLFHSKLNNDCYYNNTLDGLHPDEDGMRMIAEVIEAAIKERLLQKPLT
ncbi:MAG: SGNH/GDSL hydrolase family protein [Clostridia bacterium]|nr:SGNH/GDSL hydrolase family protein [Clostridia bacterium]